MRVVISSNLISNISTIRAFIDKKIPSVEQKKFSVMHYGKLNYKKSAPDVLVINYQSISSPKHMRSLAQSVKLKPDMSIIILEPDYNVTDLDYTIIARWFALEYRSYSLPELRTFLSSSIYLIPNHTVRQGEYFDDMITTMSSNTRVISPSQLSLICSYEDLIKTHEREMTYEPAFGIN